MQFRFRRLRLTFNAGDALHFQAAKAGNILRGALGYALAHYPDRYERIFAPKRESSPSGLTNAARPFVFRAHSLDGLTIPAGGEFTFDIHVFDPESALWIAEAFADVAKTGLGPHRSRVELKAVEEEPCAVELDSKPADMRTLQVKFVTPMELKIAGRVIAKPEFGPLTARTRDRVSELSSLYGDGPLPIDFSAFGERARAVRMIDCELTTVSAARLSTRTGQSHGLGGFTGRATYAGEIAEFVPLLTAAQFTGVGRQTTWGKGEIRIHAHS